MHVEQKKGKIVNSQFDLFTWMVEIYCVFTWTTKIVLAYAQSVHRISCMHYSTYNLPLNHACETHSYAIWLACMLWISNQRIQKFLVFVVASIYMCYSFCSINKGVLMTVRIAVSVQSCQFLYHISVSNMIFADKWE